MQAGGFQKDCYDCMCLLFSKIENIRQNGLKCLLTAVHCTLMNSDSGLNESSLKFVQNCGLIFFCKLHDFIFCLQ